MFAKAGLKSVDENAAAFKQIKKVGVSTIEVTKRAALGDLQNRDIVRGVTAKDAAQKDIRDTKLQNALRATKARVDTNWKKNTAGIGTRTNIATGEVALNGAGAQRKVLNSGTTTAAIGTRTNGATGEVALNGAVAQRKVLTRSNSVRLGTSTTTTTTTTRLGLQRHPSAASQLLVGGQCNGKTLTKKLVENKLQQVKIINKTSKTETDDKSAAAEPTLRREDSNLSRKSLTKIKAAFSKNAATAAAVGGIPKPTLIKSSSTTSGFLKKEKTADSANFLQKEKFSGACDIKNNPSHSVKQLLLGFKDIDEGDAENLILVADYVNDIYSYLFEVEAQQPIYTNHLDQQLEISPKMRSVLIDWINEVHTQFHLVAETFQLTVAIIDRYLQAVKDTKRTDLQLVGVTAIFLAAKYEELFPPTIEDFIYITDDTYTGEQIRRMERKMFKILDYNLSRPLPIHFLRRFSKAADAEDSHHAMSKYFLELAMVEYDMSHYKPSEIAAASHFLSLNLLKETAKTTTGLNNKHWNSTLEWYSRYSADHLRPIAKKLARLARNVSNAKLKAVYTKYQGSKFQKVSTRSELYGIFMSSILSSED